MRLKITWANPFTVFLCFTLYSRAISKYKPPPGAYNWRGDLTEGFLRYEFGGLIFGGAYKWRGLLSEFYGMLRFPSSMKKKKGASCSPFCIGKLQSKSVFEPSTSTGSKAFSFSIERLSITFTSNGKHEFVSRDQVSP